MLSFPFIVKVTLPIKKISYVRGLLKCDTDNGREKNLTLDQGQCCSTHLEHEEH